MKYDIDLALPVNPTVEFFEEHKAEIKACSMRIEPDITSLTKKEQDEVKYQAMNIVAKQYEFGPWRHLCKTCNKHRTTCRADPMIGRGLGNVCYCLGYLGELSIETVSKGLSE